MTRVEVNPGACGMRTVVRALSDGEGRVRLQVESECEAVRRLAERLVPIDPCTEGRTIFNSSVYKSADTCLKHPGCVVPAAMFRAVHVEEGLALPEEVWIRITRE